MVNDEGALSILEDMVYPHVDIDGVDYRVKVCGYPKVGCSAA